MSHSIATNARLLTHVALGALIASAAMPAWGQAPAPAETAAADFAAAAPAPDQEAAEIVVTGSRIRGVTATGSNVIAIDQTRIAQEPASSTADLLRRVPQVVSLGANPAGGAAQNGGANVTRSAGINLRGLGNTATLLLYDGKRFPPQGTQAQVVDPSVIPTIALERVEVVADGASAIYGSDAIAGVVNFIPRKNFNGFEVRARSGFTDDGAYNEQQLSAIAGHRWDGGWAMLAGEYTRNDQLTGSDLPFFQDDNRSRGGRDLRNTFCNPGTIGVGGTTYAIPGGGVGPGNVGALVPGTTNRCFNSAATSVLPEQERESVTGSISQNLGAGIRIFADGFYSHRDGTSTGIGQFTAAVPNTNPFFVSPVAGASSVTVDYSTYPEAGVLRNAFRSYSWNASGGVEANLFGDVRATAYYAHGESEDVADNRRGVNQGALTAALADTNPATALNLFGGPNNPATLARILDNYFVIQGASKLDVANAQISGSLFSLPGGRVRFAAGAEYRKEFTSTDLTVGDSMNQAHIVGSGSRNVKAVFGELFVPIFSADNARPGLEELSLSLAGRYEKYSDFGSTSNPKIGIVYRPIRGIRLSGTYGRSFRAPSYTEVSNQGGGAGLYAQTLIGPNGPLNGIAIGGGNPGLRPETATTWSVGAQFQPQSIRGLSLETTYFDVNYKNQIQALFGTPTLLTDPVYAPFVTLNPSASQVATLLASGLPVNGVIPTTVQFIADGRRQNLGAAKVSGIDFNAMYNWSWARWNLDAGVNGTYFTRYDFQSVPGVAFVDALNTINFPQKFRMQANMGVEHAGVRARVTLNHLSGYKNTGVSPRQKVDAYDTVDLFVGTNITEHLSLSAQVRNLFNQRPPFVDISGGYDPQSANPLPRLLMVTAGVKF